MTKIFFALRSQIPAIVSQNNTNKSCLVCVKSEKYAFWITLTPQLDRCCRGEAEVRILDFKTTRSEFQIPSRPDCSHRGEAEIRIFDFKTTWVRVSSSPKIRSQAVVSVSTPRMYPRSGYFLVISNFIGVNSFVLLFL